MQGLDPGDAMDDSAEDEAPEDDEVRTRSCQGACWPSLWLSVCRSLVAGRWLSCRLLLKRSVGLRVLWAGCLAGGGRRGRGVLTHIRGPLQLAAAPMSMQQAVLPRDFMA